MNYMNSEFVASAGEILVTLDCETVVLPAGRTSLAAIRSYLESLALANQRVLAEFAVNGYAIDLSLPLEKVSFRRIDAITVPLGELPLLLLTTAGQQVSRAQAAVEAALTLVLINNPNTARELLVEHCLPAQGTRAYLESHAGKSLPGLVRHHFSQIAPVAA